MTSSNPVYGTVLNSQEVKDIQSGPVAVSITLAIGLVYKDAANGWKQAPTDGTIHADELYWNPISLTSTATLGAVVGTFYGEGARVVGKADGIIAVDEYVKASTTSAHNGQFIALADPSGAATTPTAANVDAIRNWQRWKIGLYKGHALELNRVDNLPTAAADEDTNIVVEIRRG